MSGTIGGITKNVHGLPVSQHALPLKQSNRVNCSLDFLAAIAHEHAKSSPQADLDTGSKPLSSSSIPEVNGKQISQQDQGATNTETSEDSPADEEITDPEIPGGGSVDSSVAKMHANAATKYAEAAERHAAAALMMAGHTSKTIMLGKAPEGQHIYSSTRRASEDFLSRGRRLQQNKVYRAKLREKGVIPIKRDGKFACSLCDRVFDKEMFVWRHGVKHLGLKPFQCTLCLATFNRSDSLQRHVRNFHLPGPGCDQNYSLASITRQMNEPKTDFEHPLEIKTIEDQQ